MKVAFVTASLTIAFAFANSAFAGVGCDLNIRINNKTKNAVTIIAAESSASKTGLSIWNRIDGLEDVVLNPEDSGTGSHSKQAVELAMPCWTGKVDFRLKYLQGSVDKWANRDAVAVDSGDTVQINIQ